MAEISQQNQPPAPPQGQPPQALPPIDYPTVSTDISPRTIKGWLAAGVGGLAGWLGGMGYATLKMLKFERDYHGDARKDFMGKGGLGAAAADSMGTVDQGLSNGFGGLGRGMASHEITEYHRLQLLNSGKHDFAKMIEVIGGKGTFALLTAAGGALLGYIGYRAIAPASPPPSAPAPQPSAAIPAIIQPISAAPSTETPPKKWATQGVKLATESAQRTQGA